jgi:hypothetical protein
VRGRAATLEDEIAKLVERRASAEAELHALADSLADFVAGERAELRVRVGVPASRGEADSRANQEEEALDRA